VRILFLSGWFPYPTNNGSKLRIYHLLRGLAQQHEVTLLSFAEQRNGKPNRSELQSFCREVQVVPWKPFEPRSRTARLALVSLTPRSVADTFSAEMKVQIEQVICSRSYDLVVASQTTMAGYGHSLGGLPALFEEVELGVYYEQFAHAASCRSWLRYGLTWAKHRYYLARLLRYFRACTVASEQEGQILSHAVPGYKAVHVIPNCVRLHDYHTHERAQPNTLIFTGSFRYRPNYDAMVWFLREIYPRIQTQIPDVRLVITGDHANLPLPPASNVHLTGFVDDVHSLIGQAWISIVPIRSGGGTRLKILEALALRTPVITTSKGAEGLDVQHNEHLLIADSPDAFAEETIRLLQDAKLRRRLADGAYEVMRHKYDWDAMMPRFLSLVEQVTYGG
jgi:glycosyltransferase involved in cell wall biosynthesis